MLIFGCKTIPVLQPPGNEPIIVAPQSKLRRLTTAQYHNAIDSLLGDGLLFPRNLEPDIDRYGLQEIGASLTPISATGVLRYEEASHSLLEQVFADPNRVQTLMVCTPSSPTDSDCAEEIISNFGRQAWRRPLTMEEIAMLRELHLTIGTQADDFNVGLEFALSVVLQSPFFLYRSEYGDENGKLRSYELASRLSFLLWNSIPDHHLLEAAEDGGLLTTEGLSEQVDRMMNDPKMIEGINHMFIDFFGLYTLDHLVKDPLIFNHAHPDFGLSARQEILLNIYNIVLQQDSDFREILTSQYTYVDPRLAALYDIPAPTLEDFGEVFLPEARGRRGLLGQAGILALHSHSASTSATLRGIFIRKKLLCQNILPAPADVDASLPEATSSAPTLRERIAVHLEDPSCAGCHDFVDPIGLGLENFDGIGRWRDNENDVAIDPAGILDGVAFRDAWELGSVIADHPSFGACFAKHLHEYSIGYSSQETDKEYQEWLTQSFVYNDWSFLEMLRTLIFSDTFQRIERNP